MKRLLGMVCLTLLPACGAPRGIHSLPPVVEDLKRDENATGNALYDEILGALALSSDPAQPSGHLRDGGYRKKIQDGINDRTEKLGCKAITLEGMQASPVAYQALVRYETDHFSAEAILLFPKGMRSLPLAVFAGSGLASPKAEALSLLGKDALLIALPVLPGDRVEWMGRELSSGASAGEVWLEEADRAYALAHCLQHKGHSLTLDGIPFADLTRSGGGMIGPETLVAGVGRGALVATLVAARSGAWAFAGKDAGLWVHVSHGILANPQWSVMVAEERLLLRALVRGNTEETRYKHLPGVVALRRELFAPLREGTLSSAEVAFKLLMRDGYMMAPFVDLALKNFAGPANDQGPPAGSLLILHAEGRTDYPVNLSRVFANVATTVRFETTGATNGMNLIYREVDDGSPDSSYVSLLPQSFLSARSRPLAGNYVRPSESADESTYRRWILAESFPSALTVAQSITSFLSEVLRAR